MIKNIIKDLPNNKVPRPDRITAITLKKLTIKPIVQLYYIYKACLQLAYFPKTWKMAKIIPIPKPGQQTVPQQTLQATG